MQKFRFNLRRRDEELCSYGQDATGRSESMEKPKEELNSFGVTRRSENMEKPKVDHPRAYYYEMLPRETYLENELSPGTLPRRSVSEDVAAYSGTIESSSFMNITPFSRDSCSDTDSGICTDHVPECQQSPKFLTESSSRSVVPIPIELAQKIEATKARTPPISSLPPPSTYKLRNQSRPKTSPTPTGSRVSTQSCTRRDKRPMKVRFADQVQNQESIPLRSRISESIEHLNHERMNQFEYGQYSMYSSNSELIRGRVFSPNSESPRRVFSPNSKSPPRLVSPPLVQVENPIPQRSSVTFQRHKSESTPSRRHTHSTPPRRESPVLPDYEMTIRRMREIDLRTRSRSLPRTSIDDSKRQRPRASDGPRSTTIEIRRPNESTNFPIPTHSPVQCSEIGLRTSIETFNIFEDYSDTRTLPSHSTVIGESRLYAKSVENLTPFDSNEKCQEDHSWNESRLDDQAWNKNHPDDHLWNDRSDDHSWNEKCQEDHSCNESRPNDHSWNESRTDHHSCNENHPNDHPWNKNHPNDHPCNENHPNDHSRNDNATKALTVPSKSYDRTNDLGLPLMTVSESNPIRSREYRYAVREMRQPPIRNRPRFSHCMSNALRKLAENALRPDDFKYPASDDRSFVSMKQSRTKCVTLTKSIDSDAKHRYRTVLGNCVSEMELDREVGEPLSNRTIESRLIGLDHEGVQLIELRKRDDGPFGFYIATGSYKKKKGIFVSRITIRDLFPLLSIGDEILDVDFQSVKGLALEEVQLMMSNTDRVILRTLPAIMR